MFTFNFTYSDNRVLTFEHINEVRFSHTDVIIKDDDILHYQFPLDYVLNLFSEKENHTVSNTNLTAISISKA